MASFIGLALIMFSLFLLERKFPLRKRRRESKHRILVNLTFSLITYGTAWLLVKPAISWGASQKIGLLRFLKLGIIPELILSFLLLDLSFYYWHRLNHEWKWLWRFHNVHHFDPDLDVTTAFRFHFGEVILSTIFRASQMLLFGVSLWALAIFEIVFQVATYFHHSNVALPPILEKTLNRFLVSPRLHGIHHSQKEEETNSNYSVIFTWWDRLHGTLRENCNDDTLVIGVPGYDATSDNEIKNALVSPFLAQRDYWPKVLASKA